MANLWDPEPTSLPKGKKVKRVREDGTVAIVRHYRVPTSARPEKMRTYGTFDGKPAEEKPA